MSRHARTIALVTDFGYSDPFVGLLKGAVLWVSPGAAMVDLSHGIRARDIYHGAFVLGRAMGYFPKDTIFCVVVDPGVGTKRRPVAVKTRDYYFVGPDNGVLWEAASGNTIERAVHLTREAYFMETVSNTFHGRDIFAPVCGHLSLGTAIDRFGPEITDLVQMPLPRPERRGRSLVLTVLDQDIYGNLTLNLTHAKFYTMAARGFILSIGESRISLACDAYGLAPDNTAFLLPGSSGYMEVAVKNASAATHVGAGVRDRAVLTPA